MTRAHSRDADATPQKDRSAKKPAAKPKVPAHKWAFKPRFRARAFGWKSQPAVKRVDEAVREIKSAARRDPALGAEGAVLLLERLSPALEQVDSSSGSIGSAVGRALDALVPLISAAPVDLAVRRSWVERLWDAYLADEMPYIEQLGERWGELCASSELAAEWADRLLELLQRAWRDETPGAGYFKGSSVCLSSLFRAERYDELLAVLRLDTRSSWFNQRWRVKALAAQGHIDEALAFAESLRGPWTSTHDLAQLCEGILLACGRDDEAYRRFGVEANQANTHSATFRKLAERYPRRPAGELLADLVRSTPGDEGKWFAAAKDAGLYDEALALARRTPCDPKTLTRAARDFAATKPAFARDCGLLALHWLVLGYGYEITGADVLAAWTHAMAAAKNAGTEQATRDAVRAEVAREATSDRFVSRVLGRHLVA